MMKKILYALLEAIVLGYGTYLFVSTILYNEEEYLDHKAAGLGAFFIVIGLWLISWRKTLFIKDEKENRGTGPGIFFLVISMLSLALILGKKIENTRTLVEANKNDIEAIDSKIEDIELELGGIEFLEGQIEELQSR